MLLDEQPGRDCIYKEEKVEGSALYLSRQPWKKGDNTKGSMVQCCRCGEWVH